MSAAQPTRCEPEVLVVGGGPAGLSAATGLAEAMPGQVLLVEREANTGGIPRHSDHTGYGLRDLHRVMSGPAYARHLSKAAARAGVEIRTETMVTSWESSSDTGHRVKATSPHGLLDIRPRVVILATGARERPRTARRIPGDRPAGVLTTGQLQNLVHLQHGYVGERAVIVGSELVSWSAVLTLKEAGCKTVAMVTDQPHHEAFGAFAVGGRLALGVRPQVRTRVVSVIGRPRVSGLEVEDLDTGVRHVIPCDTVIFTGDWIPDHELARAAGLSIDPGTLGPVVDQDLRSSKQGVFAVGNLNHPVDTADVAALDGRHVVSAVLNYLADEEANWVRAGARIVADDPFVWVSPNRFSQVASPPPRGRLLLWSKEYVARPKVSIAQDGKVLAQRRIPWPAAPGRVFRVPWRLLERVDPLGGDVHVGLDR